MAGVLYLCATPIGNLEDMTFRAVRILKEVGLIAAEDTRNTIKLLNHFEIHTPMTSYHEYNKTEKGRYLIERLLSGVDVALVTDAGTPGISDPGEELAAAAYKAGITVTSLPGACAAITALTLSGLPAGRFCFEAFLPQEKKERARILEALKTETRTAVLYEAPHRLARTLEELAQELGDRRLTLCRELTKRHETIWQTTLLEALARYSEEEARGECVLVLEGVSAKKLEREKQEQFLTMTIEEHMKRYLAQGFEKKEAMKAVASDRGMTKREVYTALLEKKEGAETV